MKIIEAEQQTILLSKSFRLNIYRMPNGDLGIGTEEVRQALGYKNFRLRRFLREKNNIPEFLRRTGFTSRIQVVAVQGFDQPKRVQSKKILLRQIISLEDFKRLVFYEASRGNERAIRVQLLLAKSGFGAYNNDTIKTEKNTKHDLLEERYDAVHKKVIESMKIDELGELETEEDILSVAVSLTR